MIKVEYLKKGFSNSSPSANLLIFVNKRGSSSQTYKSLIYQLIISTIYTLFKQTNEHSHMP